MHMATRKRHRVLRTMIWIVLGIILIIGIVFGATNAAVIGIGGAKIVSAEELEGREAECILVLGASVLADETPSGILQDRLDVAIGLYEQGVAPKIIMSGDNGTDSYNEVRAMKNYAIAQGVPSDDIFCDHAGFSTYESMYRAREVFEVDSMVVVTQTYHLYRALYAANGLGINAVGVASDLHQYQQQQWFDFREIPARTKDFFQTLFHVPPTYLGDTISLNQSGDVTDD